MKKQNTNLIIGQISNLSLNKPQQTKKRTKLVSTLVAAGDPVGAQYNSWSYLQISQTNFIEIHKSIDERLMWQDPYLTQWEGAASRKNLSNLNKRYKWQEEENG